MVGWPGVAEGEKSAQASLGHIPEYYAQHTVADTSQALQSCAPVTPPRIRAVEASLARIIEPTCVHQT